MSGSEVALFRMATTCRLPQIGARMRKALTLGELLVEAEARHLRLYIAGVRRHATGGVGTGDRAARGSGAIKPRAQAATPASGSADER
jgi:hypothetical protein